MWRPERLWGRFTPEYLAYLKSPQWLALHRRALKRAGGRCEYGYKLFGLFYLWRCRERRGLQAHHLTYARLYHERLSDLKVDCPRHHRLDDLKRRGL